MYVKSPTKYSVKKRNIVRLYNGAVSTNSGLPSKYNSINRNNKTPKAHQIMIRHKKKQNFPDLTHFKVLKSMSHPGSMCRYSSYLTYTTVA